MARKNEKAATRRSVTFVLEDAPGHQVFVAGNFNDWQLKQKLEDKNGDGTYSCRVLLAPGEYQYKFVVDGEWRLDSNNPNFVPNDCGTLNSMLSIGAKK